MMGASRSFEKKFGRDSTSFGHGARREVPLRPFLITCGILLGGMLLCVAVYFLSGMWKVSDVQVTGCNRYSPEFVEDISGIRAGDKLLGFDGFAVENSLRDSMPLLRRVRVSRGLNGTVTIAVEEESALYYTCHHTNYYLISATDLQVLEVSASNDDYRRLGAVYVGLPEEARVRVGETLTYAYLPYAPESAPIEQATYEVETDEPEEEYAYVEDCLGAVSASELSARLTGMELSDPYDLYLVLDGRIQVKLGSTDVLSRKLTQAERILAAHTGDAGLPAVLDVSDPAKSSYRENIGLILPDWARS